MKLILLLTYFLLNSCAPDSTGSTVTFDATFTGNVTDASDGSAIEDANVYVLGYAHINTSTDASGDYTLIGAPAATIVLKAAKSGYVEGTLTKTGTSGGTTANSNISLLPNGFGTNKIVILLTWASTPLDLDSHLYVPDGTPTHIKFDNKGDSDGTLDTAPYAGLDVDDTNGNGPETTTIRYNSTATDFNGTYRFFVHNFSGAPDITTSSAVVTIYQNSSIVKSYSIPTSGTGQYWHVFDMNQSGDITDVNSIQAGEPAAP